MTTSFMVPGSTVLRMTTTWKVPLPRMASPISLQALLT